ncbi:MAG: substrate-binding domain-containing protein [Pseudonocardiaceae bacterium]
MVVVAALVKGVAIDDEVGAGAAGWMGDPADGRGRRRPAGVLSGCADTSRMSSVTGPSASGPSVIGADAVAAAVSAAQRPVAWRLSSAPSIDVGTAERGKQVAVITKDINPFIQSIKDGIGAAAGKAGMTTLTSNPAGSAADVERQISQAIAQHASAVITVGFTTAEIAAPLQQARSAGVPVVQLFVADPGAPPASSGVFAYVSLCYSCIGAAMADIVIHDSVIHNPGGRADVVFVNASDAGIATLAANGFTTRMRQHCPSCTTTVAEAPIAQWGTQIPAIATAAAADPKVNYIVPVFDTAAPLIVPALVAANATRPRCSSWPSG